MSRLFATVGLCLACVAPTASGSDSAGSPPTKVKEDVFADTNVLRIQLSIPEAGISTLQQASRWGNGVERPAVEATVREGGSVYTNVTVHLKGAAGSFRTVYDNPAFTLNFRKLAPGQSFHGLHQISLNNSVQDPSFLSEKICRELFDAAGVPVPRSGFAKLEFNGRDLGLRVLLEGADKQFLKRYFDNTSGNLFDGGFVQDITSTLAVNSGANPNHRSGLSGLVSAVREQDPVRRWARLQQTLDVERFLSLLAMDILQCNWDGYAMNRNNWRIFHDLASNKMVFIPHGLDQMFGDPPGRWNPQWPLQPPMQGMVAVAVLQLPEGRRRYLERMSVLYTNVFRADALLKRVDELAAVIRPVIGESGAQSAQRHEDAVRRLKARITQRDRTLKRQLAEVAAEPAIETVPPSRPRLAPGDAATLSGWKSAAQRGDPVFSEERGPDGKALLCVAGTGGETTGSWRANLVLEPGNYRFEGRLRTQGVQPGADDKTGGGDLRVSKGTLPRGVSGTADWRDFVYPFEVKDAGETELVCELRRATGKVWFDRASLRVVRVR